MALLVVIVCAPLLVVAVELAGRHWP